MSTTGPCCTAARLAGSIAGVPGLADSGALLTVADRGLTVRLTRDLWWLESRHIELARAVSAVARAHGAPADRTVVQEVQLAIAAKPDAIDVGFWRAVLGYDPMSDTTPSTPWDTARPCGCRSSIDVGEALDEPIIGQAVARERGNRNATATSPL